MKFPYFGINAFCKNSYSGNPAGVCILEEWLSTDELQKMASQVNMPETAFVFPSKSGVWSIRWFSPQVEIEICGHATLAAAYVLYEEGLVSGDSFISFSSLAGDLQAQQNDNKSISLSMPSIPFRKSSISPLLVEGLGSYPDEVYIGTDCLCVFSDEETIQALTPDFKLLAGLSSCRGISVTAKTSRIGYHFISRFFAPGIGIEEDHVTGSAHCMMAPYWGKKLGKDRLVGWQDSPRGGEVRCQLKDDRVILTGQSEVFVRGKIIS
jgi:PhzF family phenazine biosynthesis protein